MTEPLIFSAPRRPLPPGACDTHAHVFGPFERFPLPEGRSYTPPLQPVEAHQAMLESMGFDRAVIVQASAYGTDNRCTLDAIARNPKQRRGIAVVDETFDDARLAELRDAGMRGARFTEIISKTTGKRLEGASGFDVLEAVAPKFREHGLHAQIFAPFDLLMENFDRLLALDLPLVLDHLARVGPSDRTTDDPEFQRLLAMLREGRIWVKMIVFRNSRLPGDYSDVRPFHDAMIEANPDRLVWGTDWPLLNISPQPDAGPLLDLMDEWTAGDTALRDKILVDNPQILYGF
ncbi:amidohydrolase family protein [Parasphingopyxis marina]|uniref:Amidohydrolase family protein n=1 Tax=Parasphingopyxis marina TaxID=2761622 RepID=A0A842HVP8_9SPHN|nr:amidohydrolase family protein [Parasphingopyxis marina]MBC2777042.1 amidohydrolase family protein [Parasphingopyxis marina]